MRWINRKWCYIFVVFLMITSVVSAQEEKTTKQVIKHFANNNYQDGKKILDKALLESPKDSDLLFLLGKYYYQQKSYDKARFNLLKSLQYNPNNEEAKQMLVNVEIVTKHHSSAICYINELLEVSPYNPELWRKKISVYKEQGNDIEAFRLLKRVRTIYPTDKQFKKDYLYALQELSIQEKKKGNIDEALKIDEESIKANPKDEESYIRIINNYLVSGEKEKALVYVDRGLENLPHNRNLVNRKIGILTELNRHVEAVDFIQREMKSGRISPEMIGNYNEILAQAARYEHQKDPYILYEKLYSNNPLNIEALDYLINNSISRGYYEDAIVYIDKGIENRTDAKELLVKKYFVYKLLNKEGKANDLLEKLYKKYPSDSDIKNDYLQYRYKRGRELTQEGMCDDAIEDFEFVASQNKNEWQESAMKSLFNCYFQKNKYDKALLQADLLNEKYPNSKDGKVKKALVYQAQGEFEKALSLYENLINEDSNNDSQKQKWVDQYEEIAFKYIKQLNEKGDIPQAYQQSKKLVDLKPESNQGLKYLIGTTIFLGKKEETLQYAQQGKRLYPKDFYFLSKEAEQYTLEGSPEKALSLLELPMEENPYELDLVKAYSEASQKQAQLLSKNSQNLEQAQEVLNRALKYDSLNKELEFEKGIVFEKQHQYDSAYVYQKQFEPSLIEVDEFKKHLSWLKSKLYNNEVMFMYQRNEINDKQTPGLFTANYTRFQDKNTYLLGLTSSPNNGERAFLGQVEWTHILSPKWYFTIGGGISSKFFPEYMGNVSVHRALSRDWEIELGGGYKKIRSQQSPNLLQFHIGASKQFEKFRIGSKVGGVHLNNQIYYNILGRIQYNLSNEKTYLAIFGGIGSAPVDEVLNYQLYDNFSTINGNFGGIARYMVSDVLSLGLSGTWYEYTDGLNKSNLYNLSFLLYVSF